LKSIRHKSLYLHLLKHLATVNSCSFQERNCTTSYNFVSASLYKAGFKTMTIQSFQCLLNQAEQSSAQTNEPQQSGRGLQVDQDRFAVLCLFSKSLPFQEMALILQLRLGSLLSFMSCNTLSLESLLKRILLFVLLKQAL
jgi:hypothetical protein